MQADTGNGILDSVFIQAVSPGGFTIPANFIEANNPPIRQFFPPFRSRLLSVFMGFNFDGSSNNQIILQSPSFHDTQTSLHVNDFSNGNLPGNQSSSLHFDLHEELFSNQQIIPSIFSDGVLTENACMIVHYDKLADLKSNLISYDVLKKSFRHYASGGGTLLSLGTTTGFENLTSLATLLPNIIKKEKWYAILNVQASIQNLIRLRGADFPLPICYSCTQNFPENYFYIEESKRSGIPLIPVFYGENLENTFIDSAVTQGPPCVFQLTIAELDGDFSRPLQ